MLPADRYRALSPGEVGACSWCGARPRGSTDLDPGLAFVGIDVTGDEEVVPAGLIMSVDNQPARRIYSAKDGYGRGVGTVVQEHETECADCIKRVAQLIGYGDTIARAQLEERDGELTATRGRLQEALERAEQADEALKATAAFQRLLHGSEAPRKPRKAA